MSRRTGFGLLVAAIIGFVGVENGWATAGLWKDFTVLSINGGANSYYDMNFGTANPDLNGANLGTFDLSAGNSLTLKGGEFWSWENSGDWVTTASLNYRVYAVSSTPPAFSPLTLPENASAGYTDGPSYNREWLDTGNSIDLLAGLPVGNYDLEVYGYALGNWSGGTWDIYDSNGGPNYVATFAISAIPEPSTATLLLLGGLGLMALRRRNS